MSDEHVTFSPRLRADDARANYWLRQVTLRLRREITWLAYQQQVLLDTDHLAAFSPADKAQAALDMSRFWDDKQDFYQTDPTARYLTDLLHAEIPPVAEPVQEGTFGYVLDMLGLDDLAAFVLALGLAAALDHALGSVIAVCLNDANRTQPNLALVQRLWDDPDAVLAINDPAHPLFRCGLLQEAGAAIGWESGLTVPSPVARQLLFHDTPLPPGLSSVTAPTRYALPDTARLVAARLAAEPGDGLRIVPVRGPKGADHDAFAQGVAQAAGKALVRFAAVPALLANPHYMNGVATLCWLRDLALFIDEDLASGGYLPSLSIPLVLFLGISDKAHIPAVPVRYLLPVLDLPPFTYAERAAYWRQALGSHATGLEDAITEGARRFRYGKTTIDRITSGLRAQPGRIGEREFVAACRAEIELDIGSMAQKVTPRFYDERLILPPRQADQFQEVINAMRALTEVHYTWGTAQVWNEGGITALFAGPSGTGKTMGAEIIAIALDLPMYRIDLSQVVNKYIGETEKNLKKLFDAADTSDLILFFDEADSLFGRRTEVKDAHDRYANLEISYLLERMERFRGLAILATNRKNDLDEAFLRRLRFVIDFPMPGENQRRQIWQQAIPAAVDGSEIDFDFLARQFRLAGGHIRSIVFNACLQKASAARSNGGGKLVMEDVVAAVRREYDKLNRPISLDTFGPYVDIIERMEHES